MLVAVLWEVATQINIKQHNVTVFYILNDTIYKKYNQQKKKKIIKVVNISSLRHGGYHWKKNANCMMVSVENHPYNYSFPFFYYWLLLPFIINSRGYVGINSVVVHEHELRSLRDFLFILKVIHTNHYIKYAYLYVLFSSIKSVASYYSL